MTLKNLHVWSVLCVLPLAVACGTNSELSGGTGSEVAVAAMSGSSSASEGTVAHHLDPRVKPSPFEKLKSNLNPVSTALAVPSCNWSNLITSCSGNVETLSFDSCSAPMDPAIRIQGSESLTWTGASCCTATPLTASSMTPCSFTRRTVDNTGASDPLKRSIGSNYVMLDTETVSGYDKSLSGGFNVTCQGTTGNATCDGQREISITGAHYTGKASSLAWDHTVSTDAPIIEQGHGNSRKILSGTIRVQHNLAKVTSITTIKDTLTHTAGCCYPTGGSISTTYAGGKLDGKTEIMSFTSKCGETSLTDGTTQQKTGLTLHHCL
ncbi:MAG: hypothetical protein ACJ763_10380 [Bdellovibrionia bacterium]